MGASSIMGDVSGSQGSLFFCIGLRKLTAISAYREQRHQAISSLCWKAFCWFSVDRILKEEHPLKNNILYVWMDVSWCSKTNQEIAQFHAAYTIITIRAVTITVILQYCAIDKPTVGDCKQPPQLLYVRHVTSRHVWSFFETETMAGALVRKPNITSPGTFPLSTKWKGKASQFRQYAKSFMKYTPPELKKEWAVLLSDRLSFSELTQ